MDCPMVMTGRERASKKKPASMFLAAYFYKSLQQHPIKKLFVLNLFPSWMAPESSSWSKFINNISQIVHKHFYLYTLYWLLLRSTKHFSTYHFNTNLSMAFILSTNHYRRHRFGINATYILPSIGQTISIPRCANNSQKDIYWSNCVYAYQHHSIHLWSRHFRKQNFG